MDSRYITESHMGIPYEQMNKRVYINPNFKGNSHHPNAMHINPNFPQQFSNIQQRNVLDNPKIYLNPNFIKRTTRDTIIKNENPKYIPHNEIFTAALHVQNVQTNDIVNSSQVTLPMPTSRSRYSLVRHNNKEIIKTENQPPLKVKSTFNINKYKSVNIHDVKRTLDTVKPVNILIQDTKSIRKKMTTTPNLSQSRYKFVKRSTESKLVLTDSKNVYRKPSLNISTPFSQKSKSKINSKCFKKNNIPCPLFRKYGKCLRFTHGKCDFLHDKKHVSICRRFLNGVCHNTECTLSHDLTMKKMPTCYFYLSGMCTKDNCPYLHVKLNEKAKLCPDFLKGYCEKGDNCLNRHVCINSPLKGSPKYIKKKIKTRLINSRSKTGPQKRRSVSKSAERTNSVTETDKEISTHRYYKEFKDDQSASELGEAYKPSRCKLGALPSYIQL